MPMMAPAILFTITTCKSIICNPIEIMSKPNAAISLLIPFNKFTGYTSLIDFEKDYNSQTNKKTRTKFRY